MSEAQDPFSYLIIPGSDLDHHHPRQSVSQSNRQPDSGVQSKLPRTSIPLSLADSPFLCWLCCMHIHAAAVLLDSGGGNRSRISAWSVTNHSTYRITRGERGTIIHNSQSSNTHIYSHHRDRHCIHLQFFPFPNTCPTETTHLTGPKPHTFAHPPPGWPPCSSPIFRSSSHS